ncbi:MAG: dihydroorotase [Myxococcota bacterium]
MTVLIRNGRLIDPRSGIDGQRDVLVADGRIQAIAEARSLETEGVRVIDATGRWVVPGFVELGADFCEPGHEYKEDLTSGSAAATAGGFTHVAVSPATDPVIDSVESVEFVHRRATSLGVSVRALAASTLRLEGKALSPLAEMARAGAPAVSDGGHWIQDNALMRRLLEYAGDFDVPVISTPSEPTLTRGGQIHEGQVSTALGLRGIPRTAEDIAVTRDLILAEATGARLHLSGISTEGAVRAIREFKARGVRVSADANPLNLAMTHDSLFGFPVELKLRPPLRENADRLALVQGLKDGTLDCLSSHHMPQSVMEKHSAFEGAEFGAAGLQSALPVALSLVREHEVSELTLVRALSQSPADLLGLAAGRVDEGFAAHLAVVDPTGTWTLNEATNRSKSQASVHFGKTLEGRVHVVIRDGEVILHEGGDASS